MEPEEIAELIWELHKPEIASEIASRALGSSELDQALRTALSGSAAASIAEASEEYLAYDEEVG
jgi:hypothetical protein